jgi:hypothetical protein
MQYLMVNKEMLELEQQEFIQKFTLKEQGTMIGKIDPLHKLQRMSIGELTNSYDNLL